MQYIENGIPEDFARLCFKGMTVPLCELSDEEYMYIVFGVENYKKKSKRSTGAIVLPVEAKNRQQEEKSIDELELSVRPMNCLRRAGVETLGQLCKMTEFEVGKIRNMGEKSVAEIKSALAKFGMNLQPIEE